MTVDTPTMTDPTTTSEYARLNDQVRRLLDFKKSNVKGRNRTPCPECATAVDINANKCPQCASDIADHTANVRAHLAELDIITNELDQLHSKYMEYRQEEAAMQPLGERLRRVISAPQMAAGFKTVLPSFLLFFAFIATLRIIGNGPLFWAGSIAAGFVAYSLLKKSAFTHYVTVELYRAALIVGLIIMMSGAAAAPLSGWSMFSGNSVKVVRPVANIRESATTDSRIVTTANQGDKLTVLERRGAWYKVKTSNGQTGWVYSSLVKD
ncbi:MAG: SH3 domain-containing protein [Candidatus Krumholzibacteria bacterium]